MDVRICSNQQCKTVSPAYTCPLCDHATGPLPKLPLAPIGINGTLHLAYMADSKFALAVTLDSTTRHLNISTTDLVKSGQARLPGFNQVSGLVIMDALRSAADLIRTNDPQRWASWIIYVTEILEKHTDTRTYQDFLHKICNHVAGYLRENDLPLEKT